MPVRYYRTFGAIPAVNYKCERD